MMVYSASHKLTLNSFGIVHLIVKMLHIVNFIRHDRKWFPNIFLRYLNHKYDKTQHK